MDFNSAMCDILNAGKWPEPLTTYHGLYLLDKEARVRQLVMLPLRLIAVTMKMPCTVSPYIIETQTTELFVSNVCQDYGRSASQYVP